MSKVGRPQKNCGPPSYTGGHTLPSGSGYVLEHCPEHPACNARGYVLQHRLVVEQQIGRYLTGQEVVHHIDGNKANNDPANLQLLPNRAAHQAIHNRLQSLPAQVTEDQVRELLQGRTTEEVAELLGVHHQTLRNHFDHLLDKRRSPHRADDPALIALVRQAALDPHIGYREFARQIGASHRLVSQVCREQGVEWQKKSRKGEKRRTYRRRIATPTE